MIKTYDLNEGPVICPKCGKPVEYDLVAKDFVICKGDVPTGEISMVDCGWCDAIFKATPVAGGKIIFG